MSLTRRRFLASGSALTVAFTLSLPTASQAANRFDNVDGWIRIDGTGDVTVFCGKAELGTGVKTALAQMVAEELDVRFERVHMVLADTAVCPDQLPTFGSLSVTRAGPELRRASAEARLALLEFASSKTGSPVESLRTNDGMVLLSNGQTLPYGDLVKDKSLKRVIRKDVPLKQSKDFKLIGTSQSRVDIPAKVYGTHPYVQNHTVQGMLHGRVCRSPLPGAKPVRIDDAALKELAGNPRVYTKGGFVGVVADTEIAAIRAAAALKVDWQGGRTLGTTAEIKSRLLKAPATEKVLSDTTQSEGAGASSNRGAKAIEAEYLFPFQMHASIGASCAIAEVTSAGATVWSPTQSSFLTRDSLATMLNLPADKVRVVWMEGSGCYGQNGADDCTADAALLSQLSGKPVRVQWMRHDEHGHEPKGAAMAMRARVSVTRDGQIVDWQYEAWSPSHSTRPFAAAAGNLLAGAELGLQEKLAVVGADYNMEPSYVIPRRKVVLHLVEQPQLRVSALRGLGSVQNLFAIESIMDELAHSVGQDPIEFRMRHLSDERGKAVLQAVARLSNWKRAKPRKGKVLHGQGVGYIYYNNHGAYVAAVADVAVDAKTGAVSVERVSVAHDCGLVVNPDGLRNQIEGNTVQALSRALLEQVSFEPGGVKSLDWTGYPILRFSQVPKEIAIALIDRPDLPAQGAGEQTTCAVLPAVANAIFAASGARVREVPFTAERVRAAMSRRT
jgi:nicotinate dehydrogenase subunit B